jgi:cell wall-associated NlpC family hydrolase
VKLRAEAVLIAQQWLGTPYVRGGRILGAGCDCGTLLAQYLVGIGACPAEEMDDLIARLGFLSNDWFCHANSERYEAELLKYAPLRWQGMCRGIPPAQPGDIAMFRVVGSRLFNHGAIVLEWPYALHSVLPRVARTRLTLHPMTAHMEMALFDPWALAEAV